MRYCVYGLSVQSEMEMPGLVKDETRLEVPADVEIQLGAVPNQLQEATTGEGLTYQLNRREFRMELANIVKYYVHDGTNIIVEFGEDADPATVRLFLLGSAMGALLHQRGMLPIHASSIVTPNGAVLFAGPSGAGKSTIAAAFRRRGYKLLADDISVITLGDDDIPIVMPSYPQQKLWADTLEQLEENARAYTPVRPAVNKYNVPITEAFVNEALRFHSMYILNEHLQALPSLTSITGLDKLSVVFDFVYRKNFQAQMNVQEQNLPLSIAISNHVHLAYVKHNKKTGHMHHLIDLIEKDFSDG